MGQPRTERKARTHTVLTEMGWAENQPNKRKIIQWSGSTLSPLTVGFTRDSYVGSTYYVREESIFSEYSIAEGKPIANTAPACSFWVSKIKIP